MATRRYAFGKVDEATHPDSMRATLAEVVSTAIFVFAGEGSALARDKIYRDAESSAGELVAIAVAHAFGLFAAISASMHVSGGHVNPAVTFGALLGGRISVIRAIYYWIAQLLGAIVASIFLRLVTNGIDQMRSKYLRALVLDTGFYFLTFGLMYTVRATAILAIGFIDGANILVGGPFGGASMNPARAFGPALLGWRWTDHWIYWVGPLIGAGLAAVIYEFIIISTEPPHAHHQPLAPEDY